MGTDFALLVCVFVLVKYLAFHCAVTYRETGFIEISHRHKSTMLFSPISHPCEIDNQTAAEQAKDNIKHYKQQNSRYIVNETTVGKQ